MMTEQPHNLLWYVYVLSNAAIAFGYLVMPLLVLPYLPLTRRVLIYGGGFFALCGITHASMALGQHHVPVTWSWAGEHLLQAIMTWGFIITFHSLLRAAARRRRAVDDDGLLVVEPLPAREEGEQSAGGTP